MMEGMVGIDVGKTALTVSVVCSTTRQVLRTTSVANTPEGVAEVLLMTPAATPWVLEPTGRYSTEVVRQARAAQREVLLAPPNEAKAFLRSLRPRAKTDRLDSYGLALYALAVPLRPYPLKPPVLEMLDELLAARRGIVDVLAQLTQQQQALPLAADALTPALEALRAQRDSLDKRIADLTQQEPELEAVARLKVVPGIGPVTATAVTSCLQAHRFATSDAFVAYTGLDTRVRDSGSLHGRRRLSKRGNPELRRLLYLCAQANLRVAGSPFKAQYERERAKGLAHTAALCAVARKLARLCWSLHRHASTYDANRTHHVASDKQEHVGDPS